MKRLEEFEYIRNGTMNVLAFFDYANGKVHAECHADHKTDTFLAIFKRHVSSCPANEQIHYVMDNLSTHRGYPFCKAVAELSGIDCPCEKELRNVDEITSPTMHHSFRPPSSDLKSQKSWNSLLFLQLLWFKIEQIRPKSVRLLDEVNSSTFLNNLEKRVKWLKSTDKRIVIHFTPYHGSWLNLVEPSVSSRNPKFQAFQGLWFDFVVLSGYYSFLRVSYFWFVCFWSNNTYHR